MTDVLTLAENLGYLEIPPDAIRRGEVRGEPYAFRWDEIDTPPCPLGAFEYEVQINTGFGWFDANAFVRGNDAILDGQHRRVLILMARIPARIRVGVKKWTVGSNELDRANRDQLQILLASPLPAVREKALELVGSVRH